MSKIRQQYIILGFAGFFLIGSIVLFFIGFLAERDIFSILTVFFSFIGVVSFTWIICLILEKIEILKLRGEK